MLVCTIEKKVVNNGIIDDGLGESGGGVEAGGSRVCRRVTGGLI